MEIRSVAVVTGASQGIGKATALRLARDFSNIVLIARNEGKLRVTAEEVQAIGAEASILVADLSKPEAAKYVVDETLRRYGRIDALLNIAGAVLGVDLMEMSNEQWTNSTELKLHGARRMTIHAWEALKKAGGAVVFMSGIAALEPKSATAAIGVINAAIDALAKAFAEKGIKDGVQVNSLLPGAVLTERRQSVLERFATQHHITVEQAIEQFPGQVGIARLGTSEEIAGLMAYLVSPQARWLTGASIRMDGGEVKGI